MMTREELTARLAEREILIRNNLEYQEETGMLVWKNNLNHNLVKGREAGYLHKNGYIYVSVANKRIFAHRIIWFLSYGKWPEKEIDHIDGNRSNNRIENLRDVSRRENSGNGRIHRSGRLVGTTCLKKCLKNPWQARIRINGERRLIGYFPTEEEAHSAYLSAVPKGGL